MASDDAVPMIKQSIGHLSSAVHLKLPNIAAIFDKSLLSRNHVKQIMLLPLKKHQQIEICFICS